MEGNNTLLPSAVRVADWHANSSDQYSFSSQKDIWRVNQRIVSAVFPTESGFIHGADVEC